MAGCGLGLGLGSAFLASGMARHAEEHSRAEQMTEAAARGYAGSYLEAQGRGLRAGLELYNYRAPSALTDTVSSLNAAAASTAKARRVADLQCLTAAVYYEARGESRRGQMAVAQVIMNRVRHPAYPKTVCGVVYQGAGQSGCQFSFTCDGSMRRGRETAAWGRASKIASQVLTGAALADIGSATHFHTTSVSPFWAPGMLRVAQVGVHVFYRISPHALRANALAAQARSAPMAAMISAPASSAGEIRITDQTVDQVIGASLKTSRPETPRQETAAPTTARVEPAAAPLQAPAATGTQAADNTPVQVNLPAAT